MSLKQKRNSPQKTKEIPPQKSFVKPSFSIVGIGASAGGLEAISELLRNLPNDTGMAFVCVQHLDPTHKSLLTAILAKTTRMQVIEVKNGMLAEPNCVYVIPPNTCMTVLAGVLKLTPRSASQCEKHTPIDMFFKSLAEDQESRAIGVILSGTASDGSEGVKVIKAKGGMTFAQDKKSAKFEQMPHNAIATDCIDFVLDPKRIAESLSTMSRHLVTHPAESLVHEILPEETDEAFNKIVLLLKKASGVDFIYYKPATIKRRVIRRMIINRKETLQDYLDFLKKIRRSLTLCIRMS